MNGSYDYQRRVVIDELTEVDAAQEGVAPVEDAFAHRVVEVLQVGPVRLLQSVFLPQIADFPGPKVFTPYLRVLAFAVDRAFGQRLGFEQVHIKIFDHLPQTVVAAVEIDGGETDPAAHAAGAVEHFAGPYFEEERIGGKSGEVQSPVAANLPVLVRLHLDRLLSEGPMEVTVAAVAGGVRTGDRVSVDSEGLYRDLLVADLAEAHALGYGRVQSSDKLRTDLQREVRERLAGLRVNEKRMRIRRGAERNVLDRGTLSLGAVRR